MPAAGITTVESYRFDAADLDAAARRPGISAFMRIRNGAYSLEAAIRSHIGHFDEIVAVYNRCTDETPDILSRLAAEFGPKLRVFHYLPPVFPPGSAGHISEAANSPLSLVNYYNFALTRTRFSHATKLDDDHIAIDDAFARLNADVRAGRAAKTDMACFSGLNLARDAGGRVGILQREPYAGSGDHWIFPVQPDTYFEHDPRFEQLSAPGLRRRFHSIAYWHLKYLKPDFGFANYDLATNPDSRYAKRLVKLEQGRTVIEPSDLARNTTLFRQIVRIALMCGLPVTDRDRLIEAREQVAIKTFSGLSMADIIAANAHLEPFTR